MMVMVWLEAAGGENMGRLPGCTMKANTNARLDWLLGTMVGTPQHRATTHDVWCGACMATLNSPSGKAMCVVHGAGIQEHDCTSCGHDAHCSPHADDRARGDGQRSHLLQ